MRFILIMMGIVVLFYALAWACTPTVTEMQIPQHEGTPKLAIVGEEDPEVVEE